MNFESLITFVRGSVQLISLRRRPQGKFLYTISFFVYSLIKKNVIVFEKQ